ncbi:rod shape-determining protein [Candidatus Dojkabacteria bacterium]|nr:rod shape-determining protein [Candidatus Dojkabacteria bacterium]
MKLPFFGASKKNNFSRDETLLALDLGTEFVKAVVFKIIDNKVVVKGYSRTPQQSNAMRGAMIVNIRNVISTADLAIGKALAQAEKTEKLELPKRVILGIAGEFVRGVPIVANYTREDPGKKISKEEVDQVVEKVKDQTFVNAKADIAKEIGIGADKIEEISTKVIGTLIDGIRVDNPEGFTGESVGYRVFSTFAPSIHLNSIREIAGALGLEILEIVVEPYAIARTVEGARDDSFGAVFVDIGGGTTDVALVDRGGIIGTKMFAYGGRVFTKRLEVDLKLTYEKAEKVKLDYSNQKLNSVYEKKVAKALAKDVDVWTEGVEIALEEFSEDVKTYPPQIFVCGGGSALPEIREGLISYPWLQVLPFAKFPRMSFLFPNQISDFLDETKTMIDPRDIAPAALARMALEVEE